MKNEALIRQMTLYEKISLLTGADFWTSREIKRLDIPSLSFADGPGGVRRQAKESDHLGLNKGLPATCFPAASTLANSWDESLVEQVGEAIGKEAVAMRVSVLLGPGLNIKRSPLCGRNFEYYSEDPYLSGKMAAAFTRGIQENGISACPKHFAGNNQELRRMASDSIVDERTLREIYLTGFEIVVKEAKPHCMMSAYNKLNGIYANEDSRLLRDILRDEWGFDGFIVTDWGGSNDHTKAVLAGSHVEMPATAHNSNLELLNAIREGRIAESVIDKSIDEYLEVVMRIKNSRHLTKMKDFDIDNHHNLARNAASESIVLLKNESGILPLIKDAKVAVIGDFAETPRYQGAGSSMVSPTRIDTTLDCLSEYELTFVGYEAGFDRSGKKDEVKMERALLLAAKADFVLLFIGMDEMLEIEGLDRENMMLRQNQTDLLEALSRINQNIIVILCGGAPIEMPWLDSCKALVHGYLGGQAGAQAMLDILTGQICPSGKLAESYPYTYEDTPCYNYYPGKENTAEYREGIYVGYRYYDTASIPVRFPLGYGLSYTTFAYSDIIADTSHISFHVKNAGKVRGAEICQVYVGKKDSKIFRAQKELKGFVKVKLEPGQSENIIIKLDDKAFRYYNCDNNCFEIEPGIYEIYVGSSSRDIHLTVNIELEGTCDCSHDKERMPSYQSGNIQNISDFEYEALLNRKIPSAKWDKSAPLQMNDTLSQMSYSRSLLARLVCKFFIWKIKKANVRGKPDMNVLFLYNMPFRGIAKMMNGMVDRSMVLAILRIVNGHFFSGIGNFIASWVKKSRANRQFASNLRK